MTESVWDEYVALKDKLVELLRTAINNDLNAFTRTEEIADHLIANGVTFATDNNVGSKWIPITERLPEPFELVYVYVPKGKTITDAYMTRHKEWVGVRINREVTHWMPFPELPKEVE